MAALGESTHGYLADLTAAVAPHLPQDTLNRWDGDLKKAIADRQAKEKTRKSDDWFYSMTSQWAGMRQTIATARGDIDLLIELEEKSDRICRIHSGLRPSFWRLGAPPKRSIGCANWGVARSTDHVGTCHLRESACEARVLEALGDKPAAQALRWHCFEAVLSADILREYLKNLPDFEDIEAEERAHALALEKAEPEAALVFFLDWPRLDLAAKLIETQPHRWNGGDWHILPKVENFWSTTPRWPRRSSTGCFWMIFWTVRVQRPIRMARSIWGNLPFSPETLILLDLAV